MTMPNLGITGGSGVFTPYVKYNAKADKWFYKNGQGGKDEEEKEITKPTFVADFENIKTGWFFFMEGQAPQITLDAELGVQAPKPSDKHKRGFKLACFSKNVFGGVVEFSASSMHVCNAINDLFQDYYSQKDANKGKLPVVECLGSTPQKDKFGTNYKPTLKIKSWVARPVEFDSNSQSQDVEEVESEF